MTIIPSDQPIFWHITRGAERIDGATLLGQLTGINTEASVIQGAGEAAFVAALAPVVSDLPELPTSGQLEAGKVYAYKGKAVMVRQAHNRTEHDPATTPALFWTVNSGTDWIAGEKVEVGTRRTFDGKEWECIQAHATQADWTPTTTPALWKPVVAPSKEWTVGATYKLGDEVAYKDKMYRCRQAHTAQVGWEPPKVLALWLPL